MTRLRLAGLAAALLSVSAPLLAQKNIDLRFQQSSLKNQGARRSGPCFASIAALEAAYKRSGYGQVDLSEQFCSNVGNKMFWLHPNWNSATGPAPRLARYGANRTENQLATRGGGTGPTALAALKAGGVPEETYMPYVPRETPLRPYSDYRHPYWQIQRNANSWNLDTQRLPRRALTAPRYYSVKRFYKIASPRNPGLIEGVLKTKREVVIDFYVGGTRNTGSTWKPTNDDIRNLDSHSMLIVGFNRLSSNPNHWYFLCKNSWGATGAKSSGYTYISYEYLKKYVHSAAYIYDVNPPKAWPELAAIGRWNLSFDGHRGTLDIYHIPGTGKPSMGHLGITDRRLGTFFDSSGTAHRVNGNIVGNRVEFWFKNRARNMRWDEQRETPTLGRRFIYYIVDPMKGEMAGWHQDNPGNNANPAWGGYARVPSTIQGSDGFLNPVFDNTQPVRPEMHLGYWDVVFGATKVSVNIVKRNDLLLTSVQRRIYAGFEAYAIEPSGARVKFAAMVSRTRPADIDMRFAHSTRGNVRLRGFMLSHQRGVTAGSGTDGRPVKSLGFYAVRSGHHTRPGVVTYFGRACRTSRWNPKLRISGAATLGNRVSFDLEWARPGRAILAFGTEERRIELTFMGAPGCYFYTNQTMTLTLPVDLSGRCKLPIDLPNDRNLIGSRIVSQYANIDPHANTAGMLTSNGAWLKVGGVR